MRISDLLLHVDHVNYSPSNYEDDGDVRFVRRFEDPLWNQYALRWCTKKNVHMLGAVGAGTVIIPADVTGIRFPPHVHIIECEDPKYSFMQAVNAIHPDGVPCEIKKGVRLKIKGPVEIGGDGFGFHRGIQFPHVGHVIIGDDVSIGSFTCIDRGTIGDTVIGNGTKIDNLVHIAHNVRIGERCQIVAGTVIGGSAVIGDDVMIGINGSAKNKITIGNGATIGMGAVVTKDVPAGETWVGNPARKLEKQPARAGE